MSVYLYGIDKNVARDPYLTLEGTDQTTEQTLPIDWSDGASHTVTSRTIPGGALGANGFVIVSLFGSFVNGGARSVSASDGVITTNVSQSLGADTWFFETRYVVQNKNSESSQLRHWWQSYGRNAASDSNTRNGATSSTNTANDWTLTLTLLASASVATATVDAVRIQTAYIQ